MDVGIESLDQAETGITKTKTKNTKMSPRRQLGLSITFVDDDAVMRVPGIVEKEPSPSVAVVTVVAMVSRECSKRSRG